MLIKIDSEVLIPASLLCVNLIVFQQNIRHSSGKRSPISRINSPRIPKEWIIPRLYLIQKPVQEISIEVFRQLNANDILFIDSLHVCKIGSDVNYLFLKLMPQLKKGVLVHLHDIFLPLEVPKRSINELNLFWNEQYMLHAFLIGNRDFEVLIVNSYMATNHPEELARIFDEYIKYGQGFGGGSFWLRKK